MIPRHRLMLFAGDIRFAQGMVSAGAGSEAVAIALSSFIRCYVCVGGSPESERLRSLLIELEAQIEAKK